MVFRTSAFNEFLIYSCIGVVLFTSACGAPTNVIQIQPQPTCISTTPEANPYSWHQPSNAVQLYQDYKFGAISYDSARQVALALLGENTEHWSDYVDIAIDDGQMVRIVITYVDPVLVQYIVLNHVMAYASNTTDLTGFDNLLKETMKDLSDRNEMLFMVTVTSPFYKTQAYNSNVLIVKFPVQQMTQVNASGRQIVPTHADPVLNANIAITHGPVSGLVGYPLAVIDQSQCIWVIDNWSNKLILELPSVSLGNTEFPSQFWDIPYRALVLQSEVQPTPTYDSNYDWTRISKITAPPTPNWKPSLQYDDTNWRIYWEDVGRYLWDVVISESHH